MPRTKAKPKVVSLSKRHAIEDIEQLLEDAHREITHDRLKPAHQAMQNATLLMKALLSMPVRARTLKSIPAHDLRYSQSLAKGLEIMGCFRPDRPVLGIADVADELELSRSTTHRYMMSLVALGQLEQTVGRKYRLVEL